MAPSKDTPSKAKKEEAKKDEKKKASAAEAKEKGEEEEVPPEEPVGPPTEKKDINLLSIVVDAIKRRQVDYDDKVIPEPEFYNFRSRLIDCYVNPTPDSPSPMPLEEKLRRLVQVKDGLGLSLGDYHYEQGRLQSEAAGGFPAGSPMVAFPFGAFPPGAAGSGTSSSPMGLPFMNPYMMPAGQVDGLAEAQKADGEAGSEQDYTNPNLLRRTSSGRGVGRGMPGQGRKWRLIGPGYHALDLDTATAKMEAIFGPFAYIRMSGTQRGIHQYKCAHPVGPNGEAACPFRLRLYPLSASEDDDKASAEGGEDNKASSSLGDEKDKPYDVQHHMDFRAHQHGTTTFSSDGITTGVVTTATPPPKTSHPLSKPVKEFVQNMMHESEAAKTILRPAAVVQRLCEEPRFQNKPWIHDSMAKSNLQEKISNFMRNHRRKEKRASLGLDSKAAKKSRASIDAVHEAVQAAAEAMVGATEIPPPVADAEVPSPKRGKRERASTRASSKTESV